MITESSLVHAIDSEDESEFENDEFNERQNEDSGYAFLCLLVSTVMSITRTNK